MQNKRIENLLTKMCFGHENQIPTAKGLKKYFLWTFRFFRWIGKRLDDVQKCPSDNEDRFRRERIKKNKFLKNFGLMDFFSVDWSSVEWTFSGAMDFGRSDFGRLRRQPSPISVNNAVEQGYLYDRKWLLQQIISTLHKTI